MPLYISAARRPAQAARSDHDERAATVQAQPPPAAGMDRAEGLDRVFQAAVGPGDGHHARRAQG